MRVLLYFLAALTVLPYVLLSAGFVLLGQAIAAGTLFAFLGVLLTVALWLIPWGVLALAFAFVVLLALGVSERWLGAACLCLVALASLAAIVYLATPEFDLPHLLFLLPCALVMVCGGWLALSDFRGRRQTAA